MRPLVLRGFVRQQLQEHLALHWIGGFGQPIPKQLEVLFADKLFHGSPSKGSTGMGISPMTEPLNRNLSMAGTTEL
jgi:hypothetical protein